MIHFDILNRFSGSRLFTATIDCGESESDQTKKRLAVLWAINNGASLSRANLSGANLSGADLSGADLRDADLRDADLSRADLSRADLSGADLSRADLRRADLRRADLRRADLRRADLSRTDLSRTDLSRTDLSRTDLTGAVGCNDHVKCIQTGPYPIVYTHDTLSIGCQRHTIEAWKTFDDDTIAYIRENGRALSGSLGRDRCVYSNLEGCCCAVGRCLTNPQGFEHRFAGRGVSSMRKTDLELALKEEYRGHSRTFWVQVQILHDEGYHWDDQNELTVDGSHYVDQIRARWAHE